jgi:PPOX class probable F420-dependent enzyme
MRLPDAILEGFLDSWPVARLATLGPDRTPHIVPIVFARVGPHLWSPIDGKPKSEGALARVTHLRDVPRVSVLIDHYDNDWQRLWWIRVDGSACAVFPGDPERHPDAGPATARLRNKYPQYATTPLFRGVPTLIRVRITGIRSWCPGPRPPS